MRTRIFKPTEVPSFIVDFDAYTDAERVKITKAYQFIHHKTSHAGLPVYIDRIGRLDMAGLKAAYGSQERFLQYLVCYGECTMQYRFPACSLAAGKYIGKGVYKLQRRDASLPQGLQQRPRRQLSRIGREDVYHQRSANLQKRLEFHQPAHGQTHPRQDQHPRRGEGFPAQGPRVDPSGEPA